MERNVMIVAAILALLLTAMPVVAAVIPVQADVATVTVYPDRAQVACRASAALDAGENIVEIRGLPSTLDRSTAAIRLVSDVGGRMSSLEFDRIVLDVVPDEQVQRLRDRIQQLEDDRAVVIEKIKNVDRELKMLQDLMSFDVAQIRAEASVRPMTVDELASITRFMREKIDQNRSEYLGLAIEKREAQERLELAKRELQELSHPQREETLVARIPVVADHAGEAVFELSYLIRGAAWQPAYEIRALTDEGKLALRYDARITQRTGQDWNDAEITITTAAPALGAAVPDPDPNWLRVYRPTPGIRANREAGTAYAPAAAPPAAPLEAMARDELLDDAPGGGMNQATVATGTTVRYRIPGRVTIPADNNEHRFVLGEEEFAVAMDYKAVPRYREYGYLLSELVYDGDRVFLAGPAAIFQDQSYVGRIQLPAVAAGDTLTLQFGPDRRVTAAREDVRIERDDAVFGRRRKVTYYSTLVVANHRDARVSVELLDRMPVCEEEDVDIELGDDVPAPDEQRPDGIVLWRLELEPNASARIPLTYTVSYPAEMNLVGLE